jgi:hypothetical protein
MVENDHPSHQIPSLMMFIPQKLGKQLGISYIDIFFFAQGTTKLQLCCGLA